MTDRWTADAIAWSLAQDDLDVILRTALEDLRDGRAQRDALLESIGTCIALMEKSSLPHREVLRRLKEALR